jgi:hypothetical protein
MKGTISEVQAATGMKPEREISYEVQTERAFNITHQGFK